MPLLPDTDDYSGVPLRGLDARIISAPAIAVAQLKTGGLHFMRNRAFLKTCLQVAAHLRPVKTDLPGFAPFAPCLKINIFLVLLRVKIGVENFS
mgnify:CR=1 FL=1